MTQRIARGLVRVLSGLLVFESLFRVVLVALLLPIVTWSTRQLIATHGSVAVSNFDLAVFLLSPSGALVVLLGAITTLGFALAEQAGVFWLCRQQRIGWMSGWDAVKAVVIRLPDLLRLAAWQLAGYAGRAVPFALVAGLTWLLLLTDNNINYYLSEQPWQWWVAVSIGGVLALGYGVWASRVYVGWAWSIPLVMFSCLSPRAALAESRQRLIRHQRKLWWWMLCWLAANAAVTAVVLTGLHWASEWALREVGSQPLMAVPAVGLVLIVNLLVTTLLNVVTLSVPVVCVDELYGEATSDVDVAGQMPAADRSLLTLRRTAWTVVVLIIASLAGSLWAVGQLQPARPILVTAHRGSSAAAPENSLAAIRLAIEEQADYCEIDVQETADGEIVVLHDDDLMRVAGDPRKIWELTLEELQQLDSGSWFSPQFSAERVPTLRQVLELARGRIRLNIELKFNRREQQLVERVVGILQDEEFIDQCVVTSLQLDGLLKAKLIEPRLQVGHIVTVAVGDISKLDVDFFSLNMEQVNRRMIRRCRTVAKPVHVWTVNNVTDVDRLAELGVDNMITDYPERVRQQLEQQLELNGLERALLAMRHLILDK